MTPQERDAWKKAWDARLARPAGPPVAPSVFHEHTEECGPEEVRMYGFTDTQRPAVYRKCREYQNPIRWAD